MRTSSRSGIVSSVGRSNLYYTPAVERDTHTQSISAESGKFDSITLSAESASSFHKTLVGRISQEVRTATTTGDIRALRREVAAGTYQPDPTAIAARMLFIGEGV